MGIYPAERINWMRFGGFRVMMCGYYFVWLLFIEEFDRL